ncbi:Cell fate regulator YaaT, PSP1 superfamily (controls sporulation, competence, biofilm development) [Chitinophaga rupis]|uniref:Cell fate regulator YaaT, PSP1 superfamily (Controls sporulation, competence, biofilm development) n=1 Tax=Chitinophaga rupis TaxID=573321 RepID=A0A1H7KPW2_9BACT|nr:regulatory iron-sulfur-containing complex subunit RicT [Chitinophaga rupis]SEK88604.1 Cell fate regulator YaaT, PSP1 superfamily (controls sporulation, competence, biofilm development) [Chitinophaga rupis]
MACAGCGTGVDGKPAGCKSNGGCSSGGCNRLNVFDWLANIPLGDSLAPFDIIEVSFNNGSRKDFFRNVTKQYFDKGEMVTVEGISGFDIGTVSLTGELVKLQMKKRRAEDTPEVKKVLRRPTADDLHRMNENKGREKDALIKARAMARSIGLEMKLAEVEIQADGRKATFFYTADDRVDFRELIKLYASEFRVKVEMRQIGARQEAGKVGGIGSCGRELCCSTWLTDFKSVNTTAARYQNLSINQAKLSGQCGRLKCCLNYELDTYLDALKDFPEDADTIETTGGTATLQKRDIFKNLMWYSYDTSNKQYPLTISRVKEIRQLNKQGIKPEELKAVEVVVSKPKETDLGFADVVGQISLRSLEKTSHKRKQKDKEKEKQKQQKPQQQQQGQPGGQKPQQQQQPRKADGNNRPEQRNRHEQKHREPRPQGQGQQGGGHKPEQKQQQHGPRQPQQDGGNNNPPREPREPRDHKHRPPRHKTKK